MQLGWFHSKRTYFNPPPPNCYLVSTCELFALAVYGSVRLWLFFCVWVYNYNMGMKVKWKGSRAEITKKNSFHFKGYVKIRFSGKRNSVQHSKKMEQNFTSENYSLRQINGCARRNGRNYCDISWNGVCFCHKKKTYTISIKRQNYYTIFFSLFSSNPIRIMSTFRIFL